MGNFRESESKMYESPQRVLLQDGAEREKLLEDCEQLLLQCNWGEIDLTLVDLWMVLDRLLAELPNLPEWIAAGGRDEKNEIRSLFDSYCETCKDIACLLEKRFVGDNV